MKNIYLDNAATTPMDESVIQLMTGQFTSSFGNPSSTHQTGRKAKALLEQARKNIATYLNCSPSEIYFTAGGSEADNLILKNAKTLGIQRIITTKIEHHAVLHSVEEIAKKDVIEVVYLKLTENGRIDLNELGSLLDTPIKTLVSLMWINNEIGNRLDIKEISRICKQYNAFFHSDTVQGIGHLPLNIHDSGVDFLAASAHKFHGPKGVGFAFIKKGITMNPLILGGEQERGMRAGTENVVGIFGMEKALEIACTNMVEDQNHLKTLKSEFVSQLKAHFPDIKFNGTSEELETSAPHILSVRFPISIPMLLFQLDLKGIAASGGSACQSGSNKGSHVLQEILPENEQKKTTVRFSFSKFNTLEEISYTLNSLKEILIK